MERSAQNVLVRRIDPDEGLALRDLRVRSIADSPGAFGQTVDEARARTEAEWHRSARQSAHGDSRTWLLAEIDGVVGGIVQGRKRRPETLLLFSMWVDSSFRRQGVGRGLIAALEGWALGWDAIDTILWAYGGNEDAIRFYRDLGFEVIRGGRDAESGARFGAIAMHRAIQRNEPKGTHAGR